MEVKMGVEPCPNPAFISLLALRQAQRPCYSSLVTAREADHSEINIRFALKK
jgi:hypothetical protein